MKKTIAGILLVDDELPVVRSLERSLRTKYNVYKASNGEEGLQILENFPVNVIISDERMPGISGVDFLELSRKKAPDAIRIIISGYSDSDTLKKAINLSKVHAFINKPVDPDELINLIEKNLNEHVMFPEILGKSQKIQEVFKLIKKAANTSSTILITGESGTGKELVASAVHRLSARSDKPFIAENCAAITQSILETELFGHVKGSFTGATMDKIGLFEMADKGILFLDEIGDISKDLQTKLLRVIETGVFRKVGGTKNIEVDVQIILATNKNILKEVEKKNFREDLYYRINVINIALPPLRERKVDIPILAQHFLKVYSAKLNKKMEFENDVNEILMDYDWPGNVRELEHEIERAAAITDDNKIGAKQLTIKKMPKKTASVPVEEEDIINDESLNFYEMVEQFEKRLIQESLKKSGGSKRKAAAILNMTRQSLCNKINKYNLDLK